MSNITTENTEKVQIAHEGLSVPGKGLDGGRGYNNKNSLKIPKGVIRIRNS